MSNLDACPAKGFDLRRHSWPDLGDPARKNGKKGMEKERKERTIRVSTRRFVTRTGPCDKTGLPQTTTAAVARGRLWF
jgi:hypothetical protein